MREISSAERRNDSYSSSSMKLYSASEEAIFSTTSASFVSVRAITSTPLCSSSFSATHCPKPVSDVVTVGTEKAMLSSGV